MHSMWWTVRAGILFLSFFAGILGLMWLFAVGVGSWWWSKQEKATRQREGTCSH